MKYNFLQRYFSLKNKLKNCSNSTRASKSKNNTDHKTNSSELNLSSSRKSEHDNQYLSNTSRLTRKFTSEPSLQNDFAMPDSLMLPQNSETGRYLANHQAPVSIFDRSKVNNGQRQPVFNPTINELPPAPVFTNKSNPTIRSPKRMGRKLIDSFKTKNMEIISFNRGKTFSSRKSDRLKINENVRKQVETTNDKTKTSTGSRSNKIRTQRIWSKWKNKAGIKKSKNLDDNALLDFGIDLSPSKKLKPRTQPDHGISPSLNKQLSKSKPELRNFAANFTANFKVKRNSIDLYDYSKALTGTFSHSFSSIGSCSDHKDSKDTESNSNSLDSKNHHGDSTTDSQISLRNKIDPNELKIDYRVQWWDRPSIIIVHEEQIF